MLALLSRIGLSRICQLFVAKTLSPFSRGAKRRCDCDGYRPDTSGDGNQSQADYGCFKNPGESLSVNEYLAPTACVTTCNPKHATPKSSFGGRKRLWLIQMIVPTHLKAGFGKRGPEFFATGPSDDASDIDS